MKPTTVRIGLALFLCAMASVPDGPAAAQQGTSDALAARLSEISQVGAFQWSPDGTQIAYLSNESGMSQIHLLTVVSGATRQLTRHESAVWDPQWSPDGTRLLFLSDPGWQERNEVWEIAVKDGKSTRLLADGAVMMRNARWSPDGSRILLETNGAGQVDLAVWKPDDRVLRPFIAQPAARLDPQWSPDGKWVAFLSGGALWISGSGGENPRAAVTTGLGGSISSPRWSPDSGSIVFVTDLQGNWDIGLYSLTSDKWRLIASEPWEEMTPTWSSDGTKVAFVSTQGFDKKIGIVAPATGQVEYVTPAPGVAGMPRWNPAGPQFAYLFSTPQQPQQLWQFSDAGARQLTRSAAPAAKGAFVMSEPHTYPNREGMPVPALLYKPADFKPGTRYPAIMVVHGSFEGQWINDFDPIAQYFLQKGFVLFYPNPRGSGGYGRAYERLNDGDWGGGDTEDLIRGRDYLADLSFVDPERIAAWGGSYGGYLTYTLVTQAPDKFQAAVVRAGINDLRWQVVERRGSPARFDSPLSGYPKELGGLPDQNAEFYRDRSPLTWVKQVKAPMLLLHGLRDSRVAPSQSRIWADALRANGVPVELHEYPTEDHTLTRMRETIRDQMERITRFLNEHMPG